MRPDMKIADSMLELIGDIPLVRLNRIGKETGAEILVKPEFLNPSGSIKDRIAKIMIEDAEEKGFLKKGSKIVEATTGNTGTALAFVSAVKGYDFVSYVPDRVANKSRLAIMLAFGCKYEAVDSGKQHEDTSEHGGFVEPGRAPDLLGIGARPARRLVGQAVLQRTEYRRPQGLDGEGNPRDDGWPPGWVRGRGGHGRHDPGRSAGPQAA